ncbi:hypothetical protein V8C35DRAFT_313063, partial [Trichoderma chlorosporum]
MYHVSRCIRIFHVSHAFSLLFFSFLALQGIADSVVELEAQSSGNKEVFENQRGVVGIRTALISLHASPPLLPTRNYSCNNKLSPGLSCDNTTYYIQMHTSVL